MQDNLKAKIALFKEKAENFRVLYVEDEQILREEITSFLSKIFTKLDSAENGEIGLKKYTQNRYDIVITDIMMPKMDGLEMISKIKEIDEQQEIVVVSAYTDPQYFMRAIELGVTGYIIKPIDFYQIVKVLGCSVDKLSAFRQNEIYKRDLEAMVKDRTKTVLDLQHQQVQNYKHAIRSLVKMIEARDTYTGGHSERVADYSKEIAKMMGLKDEECNMIYESGILHDIGKIITPDAILLKPNKLTQSEYSLIKEHVAAGYNILNEIPMYSELAQIVYAHHEHWDGSGYPRGLRGEDIPLASRIMAVADSFDAMTTRRIYKAKMTTSEAIKELERYSGIWYDSCVVKSAVEVLKSVKHKNNAEQLPNTFIDDERFAYFYKDPLTNFYNHYYLDSLLQSNRDSKEELYLNIFYIQNFSIYNKKHGWSKGDLILKSFGEYLKSQYPHHKIFRIFGDSFVLLSEEDFKIDLLEINSLPFIKSSDLFCISKYYDLQKVTIESFKDLQE